MAETKVEATVPGLFYRRPNPEAPPYVEEGGKVIEEQIIGLVEVMKTYVEVKSPVAGILRKFLVENEGVVDAGQAVAVIEN
jgi:acetyl-CoA carboxylase biotin carboxyl carrier protein